MTSRITSPSITAQLSTNIDFELRPNPVFCGQSRVGNSRTWSYASGGLENLDVVDGIDDRSIFVDEYNRLAQKVAYLNESYEEILTFNSLEYVS